MHCSHQLSVQGLDCLILPAEYALCMQTAAMNGVVSLHCASFIHCNDDTCCMYTTVAGTLAFSTYAHAISAASTRQTSFAFIHLATAQIDPLVQGWGMAASGDLREGWP